MSMAVAGGLLLYAAFPPTDLWFVAPLGPVLLALAVRGRSKRSAFLAGAVFGLAFFGPLIVWLANLGVAAWLALTLVQALILGVAAVPLPRLLALPGWPLFGAAWWVAVEALRGRVPLGGFPWGRLAFSQADAPYAGWAAVGGAPLLTFAVALAGMLALCGVTAVCSGRYVQLAAVCAGAATLLAVPLVLPTGVSSDRSAVVAVVQGNVPRTRSLAEQARVQGVAENHARETARLAEAVARGEVARPDVVIWPENSLDSDPAQDPALEALVADSVRALDRPLLIGAILRGPGDTSYNAGQLWLPGEGPVGFYAKRQLVPFGEYIPARSLLGGLGSLQLIPRDFTPGTSYEPLRTGQTRLGDVICYEIAYDGRVRDTVRAGANLLVVQTNNATYERGLQAGQSEQQLAMARLRAIEYGRSVALASTSGVSAIVAPDGRVTQRADTWRSAFLVRRVPLSEGRTLAERAGPLPEVLLSALALAGVGAGLIRRRRRTAASPLSGLPEPSAEGSATLVLPR
ncbi:apolipoprotein N-acyltransferase [Streptomyces sp. NBC_00160]|uniref:apolipoprotein N-acyltransferase n=1 Tax=Streptomyces sp. NBC_00160 TaxID=2903628 RepID=UPI0022516C68|nr:apolipoprotein N-acyltransferase [Streptomyces sp. NBC_00160]MCX5302762.1 apolipoprotein N-acyltransferase [Streptomyces sp. NBC_00160]